jgi:NAD(P)H dehydrogenase (quinone)
MSLLVTGAAGNLGSQIVSFLAKWNDPSSIIATSRSSTNKDKFTSQGLQFRVADFADPPTLQTAFAGVEKLLIISTMDYDTDTRIQNQKERD